VNAKLKEVLDELRGALSDHYGERLSKLVLFGSQARGDAEEDSDIDVLVVLKGDVTETEELEATNKLTAAISLKHDVVVSCVFVSEARYLTHRSPLLLNVRREGVQL
jgi:predicted nucleotidyltransferase